jgi:hypothetical protein
MTESRVRLAVERLACIFGCAASVLMLLLLAAPVEAAEATGDSTSVNSLHAGAVGIEFGVNSVFGGGFGGTVSGKIHAGRSTAIRIGGGATFSETEGTGNSHFQDPFEQIAGTSDDHDETRSYSAFVQLMQYLMVHDRLAGFLSVGPIARWNSDSYTEHDFSTNGDAAHLRFDSSGWAAGLDLSVGFEWFFQHGLSLGARYGFSGLYGESNHTQDQGQSSADPNRTYSDHESGHDKTFQMQTNGTLLTLTAYF